MAKLLALLLLAFTLPAQTPQRGAKGGCYIVVTSKKTGKTYRRYVSKDKCK